MPSVALPFCRPLACIALALVSSAAWARAATDPSRHTFTNFEGRTVSGRVVSYEKGEAKVQRDDGVTVTLNVSTLTSADEAFLDEWKRQQALKPPVGSTASPGATANATVAAATLIKALGHPLLEGDNPLWKTKPEAVATRLKWPRESQTPTQTSFRAYPNEEYRFAGARPFSAALYGENGQTTGLSLVFANRGDSFGAKGSAEEHFDRDEELPADALSRLKAAIKADADAIAATLTGVLGEPEKQNYGEGEGRRRVLRWDWLGHAFLLSEEDEQYVGLAIVPSEFADARGKTARISDASVRERIRASVEKRPHGDVVIANLPMVDQGPKGYCAPATCERAMRHVGISADMYLLAVAGGTGLGGGVSVERMLQTIGRDIKRKGRSFDTFGGPLSLKKLAKYIDDGLPVLWRMDSVDAFNELANARTKERKSVTDWDAWKQKLAADDEGGKIVSDDKHAHCTMIIGYNKETGEIAFSDSWGQRFTERWVRVEEAQAVSKGAFYVIGL
jgi:hypothetical protein